MKKLIILSFFFILSFKICKSQKSQVISINNSLVAVTFEASTIDQTLKSEGDAKYYTLRRNANGIGGVKNGTGSGFDVGFNFEFSAVKNARNAALFAGVHFMQTKANVFVSQGSSPDDFFSTWAVRYSDSVGALSMNTIRVPMGLNFYFTIGKKKNAAVGLDLGADLYYNFSATLKKPSDPLGDGIEDERKVTDAINKFNVGGFAGLRLKYKRLYAFYHYTVLSPKKVWTEDYGSNEETKQTYQRLGIGFYIKK